MFVERVKKLLLEKNIFAKKMLADLEINKNQMTRWEKSEKLPSKAILIAIAYYLDTTVEYLIGETDVKEQQTQIGERTDAENSLIIMYRSLNHEGQEKVMDYLTDLNESGRYKKDSELDVVHKEA